MKINATAKTVTLPKVPKRVKKITGTRFAAILGLNPWSTPFEAWCDMTGTYKIPFEDTKYTIAGKAIEPKVIAYLDQKYYFGRGLLKGADEYFAKPKEALGYDHFPNEKIFGGMWDARTKDAVYELKTTQRVEDWYRHGQLCPPEYYKLQAALYAWLLGLDTFYLVLTILEETDYARPEDFVPTPVNTIVKKFSLKAEYPDFAAKIEDCLRWCERHITTPVSPPWDETKRNDKEIVKALTTAHVQVQEGGGQDIISELIARIEPLQERLDAAAAQTAEDEKALKTLKDQLKSELAGRMKDNDKKIEVEGVQYIFEVSRAAAGGVDTERLKADGLYDKYKKTGFTTKFNVNRRNIS